MGKLYLGTQEIAPLIYDYREGTGIPREVDANGAYGFPAQNFTFSLPEGATRIANYGLAYAFYGCTSLTSADLSSLTIVPGGNAFLYAFSNCGSLTSVDLSSLTTISSAFSPFEYAFRNCASLPSVNFPSLTDIKRSQIFNYAFQNCTSLTSVSFPALTASSFGSNTDQFSNMLYGCTNVTVHFPAAIQSTISSWSDVTRGFGGTNTTVLFDL